MSMLRLLCTLVFMALITCDLSSKNVDDELDISGFILDKTVSRFGKIYFSNISSRWEEHAQLGSYSIIVEEKYVPQTGSLAVIYLNGKKVMQLSLGRKEHVIIEHSKNTVNVLINILLEQQFPANNPDLAHSGI